MALRLYHDEDLPKLVNLVNEAYKSYYEFIPYTEEKIREELQDAQAVYIATDEQDQVRGLARLHREWYGEEIMLCVPPGPERHKTEELLLSAIEQEAQSEEVSTVIDPTNQEQLDFFISKGYQPESSFYQMIAELDKPRPIPLLSEGYSLRNLRPDEEEAFVQLVNIAYEGERLQRGALMRWKTEDPAFSAEWVQVAEHEGQLVSAVVARPDREFNKHYHAKRGYLGPAATLPAHQGKGLAKALTAKAMNFLRERGLEQVSLYTWEGNHGALRVTQSLGFRISRQWKILTKSIRTSLLTKELKSRAEPQRNRRCNGSAR